MAQVYPMGDGFMWCIGPQREVLATMPNPVADPFILRDSQRIFATEAEAVEDAERVCS